MQQKGRRTLEILSILHDRLSITVMLFMFVLGLWGLVAYMRGQAISGNLAGAFVIGELLIVLQVAAGVLLLGTGARSPGATHYLYGITAILVLPFAWSYFRERNPRQAILIYSLLSLFIFGLAVRGIMTGR